MSLTPLERDQIRALLEELRDDLEPRVQQLEVSSTAPSLDEPIGRLTRMDAIQSQHMALAGLRRLQLRLERVRQALVHVEEPGFGLCEGCGEAIGFARLEFEPETSRCVQCAR